MDEQFEVECPYCGETIEVYIEADVTGSFIQDCEVCCNPWRIVIHEDAGDRSLRVTRADGSE